VGKRILCQNFGASNSLFLGSIYSSLHRLDDPEHSPGSHEKGREAKDAEAKKEAGRKSPRFMA
jgi:hypothetical protein